jgi:hypothetical protein
VSFSHYKRALDLKSNTLSILGATRTQILKMLFSLRSWAPLAYEATTTLQLPNLMERTTRVAV